MTATSQATHRARVARALPVIAYLESDPQMYAAIEAMASLEATARGIRRASQDDVDFCVSCRRLLEVAGYDDEGGPLCRECA